MLLQQYADARGNMCVPHAHTYETWRGRPVRIGLNEPRGCRPATKARFELRERAGVAIDGVDRRSVGQQIGERERERARTGAKIGPDTGFAGHAVPQEIDVVRVIH